MRKFIVLILSCLCVLLFTNVLNAQGTGIFARVIAFELNVRDSYQDQSQIVGMLTVDAQVEVLGRENEAGNGGIWMYVSPVDSDFAGWVLSVYLEFSPDFILQSIPVMSVAAPEPTSQQQVQESASEGQATDNNAPIPVTTEGISIPGSTRAIVNMRGGPGTSYEIMEVLDANQAVVFIARNDSSTWLQALIRGGVRGWLSYTFVNVDGSVSNLPVAGAGNPVVVQSQPGTSQPPPQNAQVSSTPGVIPSISTTAREIYLRGQQMGNRSGVFSKVGDSITASNYFLAPIGLGGAQLYDYAYLQPVIDHFSQVPARDHFSFANSSLAARGGWTTFDVLDPQRSVPGVCDFGETPLACEYRNSRPSVALIMFGTNDITWVNSNDYRVNLERIVQISIDMGVIPVLSTIPEQPSSYAAGRVAEFNSIIVNIAASYNIPLWNYWLAMQELPNQGLGGDNVHPSYNYGTGETAIFSAQELTNGYNIRNLTALMVLDAVWRGAMY